MKTRLIFEDGATLILEPENEHEAALLGAFLLPKAAETVDGVVEATVKVEKEGHISNRRLSRVTIELRPALQERA